MTPPDQLQASAPGLLFPPPPGARRPNSRFKSRRVPLAAALFFPSCAPPAYNGSYMRPLDALTRHASSWGRLVTISVFAVLTAALVMAVWWAATTEERTGTYIVRGTVNGITLDIGDADLDIIGGGTQAALQVSRTDRFSFGHPAEAERVVRGGTLRLHSRCPAALIGSCSSSYRLRVPDNVPVTVKTTSGDVASSGYRGSARVDTTTGDVNFNGWCGFNLQIRADAGDVRAVAACSPERLQLRSRQGRVDALVPPGRYRVDAESDEGRRSVRGVTVGDDAPFQIQALSTTGDVSVGSGP
jgi:Putative adhesin